MMKKLVFIWLLLLAYQSKAQKHVQVIGDANLDSLVLRNQELNTISNGIPGYRVQIFFGTDRKVANENRTKFLQEFPDVDAYLIYQQPYFKVRVGDFRNQLEAQGMYHKLLTKFDKVFIVPDKINLPRL
ncbi:MAG: SPOR domain-containing protein [Bacteroidetes bacterium]|nr:MAG: SPOR domain-containing protein [Bacteroidota bacterium]